MNKNNHPVNKLLRFIKKNGIKCLLPQNLTNEILHRLILEADAIDRDNTENFPSSTLLISILHLKNKSKTIQNTAIKIETKLLMKYFNLYVIAIRLEDMRRKGIINIHNDFLPTLENIFDEDREMDIHGLY